MGDLAPHLYGDHQYDTHLGSCSYCARGAQQLVSRFDRRGFRPRVRRIRSRRLLRPTDELRPSGLLVRCSAAVLWCAADYGGAAILRRTVILFHIALFCPIARRGVTYLLEPEL